MNKLNVVKERIVIIGGGFAGLNLLKKLDKNRFDVVLVDKHNYHAFPPLFYQIASGGLDPASICFPFRRELRKAAGRGASFHIGEVKSVDVSNHTVTTTFETLHYDKLVIAAGTTNNYFNMPELQKTVYTLKSAAQALRCRNDILERMERASIMDDSAERRRLLNFVVIGGGPTGVEIAGALGEMKRYILPREYPALRQDEMQITLVEGTDRLLRTMSEQASRNAAHYLDELMVNVKLGVNMQSVAADGVTLADGTVIDSNMVIWTAGVTGMSFSLEGTDVQRTRGARFAVDAFNRVEGMDSVFALGDISMMTADPAFPQGHPQLAQVAIQQAANLARNLNAGSFDHKFVYNDKGSMATVGRNRAVVDLNHMRFGGFSAWMVWMFIHLISILGMRNKVAVLINWLWAYFTYGTSLRLIMHPNRYPLRERWGERRM